MKGCIEDRIRVETFEYSITYTQPEPQEDEPPAERARPFYELFIMLEGAAVYTVEKKKYALSPTQCVLIPPFFPAKPTFTLSAQNPAVRTLVVRFYAEGDLSDLPFGGLLQKPFARQLNAIPEIITLIHNISHHNSVFTREEFALLHKTYLLQFLMLLNKLSGENFDTEKTLNHLTLHVLSYINQHLTEKINVKTIAAILNFTEPYITRTFKADMGISIMQYIKQRRLELAHSLIYGGEKPIQAMYKSGFTDYSNFFKIFIVRFGQTPKELWLKYRKESPQGKRNG